MHRVRSTDVWYNMPGVVAAYQPVAAPGPLLARQNVSNEQRTPGLYMATPGVAPAHDSRAGWTFNGSSTYLSCGVVPFSERSTVIIHVDRLTNNGMPFGTTSTSGQIIGMRPYWPAFHVHVYYNFGTQQNAPSPEKATGVFTISGADCYFDGAPDGTIPSPTAWSANQAMLIGAQMSSAGFAQNFVAGNVRSVMFSTIKMSLAAIWLCSRQMAYCHVNPDWSAWGRRRRYYYAPSQAAALAAWRGVGRNSSPVGGSIGVNP